MKPMLSSPRARRWLAATVVLFALLGLRLPAAADGYTQHWARASIVLMTGDTIDGPVTYYHDQETLEVQMPDGTLRTFPAVNVSYFVVSHERAQRLGYSGPMPYYGYRGAIMAPAPMWRPGVTDTSGVKLYVTYLWNGRSDYSDFRQPMFFQQLTDGNVRLLRREQLVQRMMSPGYGGYYGGYGMPGGYYTEVRSTFYLGDPEGKVTELRSPKKDLLAYFPAHATQIKAYAKQNKLDYDDPRELALILRYADGLANGTSSATN